MCHPTKITCKVYVTKVLNVKRHLWSAFPESETRTSAQGLWFESEFVAPASWNMALASFHLHFAHSCCCPFSTGPIQFPYNPLTMRILSNTPPTSIASPSIQSQQQQLQQNPAGAPGQRREWQSLLSEQYETLSDSDDWAPLAYSFINQKRGLLFGLSVHAPLLELTSLTGECNM